MTEYLNKTFSVHAGVGQSYRDNWDRIFGKKGEAKKLSSEDGICPVCLEESCDYRDKDLVGWHFAIGDHETSQ